MQENINLVTAEVEFKLLKVPPPFWNRLKKEFRVNWDRGVAVTYGHKIYSRFDLPDHVIVHEKVHIAQQDAMGKDEWWSKYLEDPKFRLSQEVEAYRAQMFFIKGSFGEMGRKTLRIRLAKDLSSMYGKIGVNSFDALQLIDGDIEVKNI